MQGTEKNEGSGLYDPNAKLKHLPGVIPRAVDVLLQAQQDRPGKTEIRMSFLEIYNEKVIGPKN